MMSTEQREMTPEEKIADLSIFEAEDEDGNALCYGCLSEVVDSEGTLCDLCEEEDEFRI
jgi:hypothetical protein